MGIPDKNVKYVLGGTLGATEIWNCAFWERTTGDGTGVNDAALAIQVASPTWVAFKNALFPVLSTGDAILTVDNYFYMGGAAVAHGHAIYSAVGSGAVSHAKQTAVVLTERTALATRSGRGRIYLPCTGAAINNQGILTSGPIDGLADAFANLLGSLIGAGSAPVVVSQTHTMNTDITSVSVDYVPDTQRRRRNKLVSSRHTHTVP